MTHQELVQQDFQAKIAVIDAERSYLRSQIALLEAQLKQNAVKAQELEFQWNNYVENLKRAQAEQEAKVNGTVATETATGTKTKKAAPKA